MRGLLPCGRGRSVWLGCVAAIGVMIVARDAAAASGDAFQQASDGLVSIEAEHHDANVPNGGQSFVASSQAGASGSGALTASPNSDVIRNTGYAASSPRLEYRVNFVKTGTHYIWARGIGPTAADDSFHAGVDGAELASSDRITGFGTGWTWSRDTMDGPVATVTVATTGVHVVDVWMREDGFIIDKLVITTDSALAPTGLGPAESARQASTTPPPPPPPPSPGAFIQSGDANGIVSMEAEHFATNTAQGGRSWLAAAGGTALQAMPNAGVNQDTSYTSSSPRLDFAVNFVKTGVHYIWARGMGATAADDSYHAGLDGAALTSSDRISGFGTAWTWSRSTMDGPLATFTVGTAGVHTVNVWMREDGFVIDKLVVTSNANYAPSGTGPAESPTGTLPPPACGDGACNGTESAASCPADCGPPPPACGDGACNGTESAASCPADCGPPPPACGDGACNGTESAASCPADCGPPPPACGDGACNGTESTTSCPADCASGAGTTWIIDSKTGNDSGSGRASAPWRTWGKLIVALNAGTIAPGDRVLIRPGRYAVCEGQGYWESLRGAGGTASAPITISVDTSLPGDVEIHGAARAGQCGSSAWLPAKQCTSGSLRGAVCDANSDCPGAGTCTSIPNVFYTVMGDSNANSWEGGIEGPGVAFQPSLVPVGGAPRIFEILYSDEVAAGTAPKMPTFTPGRDQYWPYPIMRDKCTASKVPWLCCTGAGAGTCGNPRGYVQTASGASPDAVGNAQYGPVELPLAKYVLSQGNGSTVPTTYLRFTNRAGGSDSGRTFYFWWATTGIMQLGNAHHLSFEDFDIAYNSRATAMYDGIGTSFPRLIGGDTYLVNPIASNSSYGPRNVVHDIAFRQGKIHGSQGNEMVHANSGATDRFYGLSFDHVEFTDGPWSVPDGASTTSGTGNANTNQVSKMWPPPNHRPKWSNTYNTHWSPLGGGGLSSGAMIINTPDNVVRNCYFHDVGLISFHENPNNMGNIFENNLVDFGLLEYADAGVWYLNGVQMAGFHPPLPVDYCVDGADRCSGYTGSFGVTMRTRSASPNQNGNIVRNNVFVNAYAQALFFNDLEQPSAYAPGTPHQIVNNTFIAPADARYLSGTDSWIPVSVWGNWASPAARAIVQNNVFRRSAPSATGTALFQISTESLANTTIDYNDWGAATPAWLVGANHRTSFADFRGLVQTIAGADNEAHSINVDPQFVLPFSDLHLRSTSPARQTGRDLGGVGWAPSPYDYDCDLSNVASCTPRPAGRWSMGAFQ